jgi:hypothetical protein
MRIDRVFFLFLFMLLVVVPPASAQIKKQKKHLTQSQSIVALKENRKQVNRGELVDLCIDAAHPKAKDDDIYYIVNHVMQKKNPLLLISIIQTESSFLKTAVSKHRAVGLMQIRPNVWMKELKKEFPDDIRTPKDLFKISTNIDAGEFILNKYIEETGSLKKALVKYSGGSRSYANKVLKNYYKTSVTVTATSNAPIFIYEYLVAFVANIRGAG